MGCAFSTLRFFAEMTPCHAGIRRQGDNGACHDIGGCAAANMRGHGSDGFIHFRGQGVVFGGAQKQSFEGVDDDQLAERALFDRDEFGGFGSACVEAPDAIFQQGIN